MPLLHRNGHDLSHQGRFLAFGKALRYGPAGTNAREPREDSEFLGELDMVLNFETL